MGFLHATNLRLLSPQTLSFPLCALCVDPELNNLLNSRLACTAKCDRLELIVLDVIQFRLLFSSSVSSASSAVNLLSFPLFFATNVFRWVATLGFSSCRAEFFTAEDAEDTEGDCAGSGPELNNLLNSRLACTAKCDRLELIVLDVI